MRKYADGTNRCLTYTPPPKANCPRNARLSFDYVVQLCNSAYDATGRVVASYACHENNPRSESVTRVPVVPIVAERFFVSYVLAGIINAKFPNTRP